MSPYSNSGAKDAVKYFESLLRFGSRPGLDAIRALLARLGNPELSFKVIHIAGTNGKGSTAAMIAEALTTSGLKTGLYLSPAVDDFFDRIRINGQSPDEAVFLSAFEEVRAACDDLERESGVCPTEFETVTATALVVYKKCGCTIVVLETGLGGRFDATNVVDEPLVSVIMSISRDHTKILGDTIEAIAFEKCGIIKNGRPVVTYAEQPKEALAVIKDAAADRNSRLIVPDISKFKMLRLGIDGAEFEYEGKIYKTRAAGRHFALNALSAIETLKEVNKMGINVSDESIEKGLAAFAGAGRLEVINEDPMVIIDGAHNEDAVNKLCETLDELFPGKRIITVMGMFADKEYEKCVPPIARRSDVFIATEPHGDRALYAMELFKLADGVSPLAGVCRTPKKALRFALLFSRPGDVVLCCGSFSMSAEFKEEMELLTKYNAHFNIF